MDKILEKIKKYFEDEVRIQWQEFEQYPPNATEEQK
jgi:hypothetical protein